MTDAGATPLAHALHDLGSLACCGQREPAPPQRLDPCPLPSLLPSLPPGAASLAAGLRAKVDAGVTEPLTGLQYQLAASARSRPGIASEVLATLASDGNGLLVRMGVG